MHNCGLPEHIGYGTWMSAHIEFKYARAGYMINRPLYIGMDLYRRPVDCRMDDLLKGVSLE